MVCLCETWIKEGRVPKFVNYTALFVSRHNSLGGGVAILTRNDLSVVDKPLEAFPDGFLEVQALTVCGHGDNIDVLHLYNPSQCISEQEFQHFFQKVIFPCIVTGELQCASWFMEHQRLG